jgi:hypothetical protein
MPIVPFFDPATGASGGPSTGGSGGLPWSTLAEVDFKAQGTLSLANGTAFTLTDVSGRSISGTSTAAFVNQPAISAGWDAARGYYVEVGNTATNSTGQISVPIAFAPGVSIGLEDDLRITVTGLINLPIAGHRNYWMVSTNSPATYGYETSGAQGITQLRFNSTTSYLRFDFNGGQSANYTPTSPVNPGTTLDMINGTQVCEMLTFQPRRSTRGETIFSQPNISRSLRAFGGQDAQSPVSAAQALASPYSVPYPWNGKTAFHVNNTIYNAALNGLGAQFSQIHRVKFERRTIA